MGMIFSFKHFRRWNESKTMGQAMSKSRGFSLAGVIVITTLLASVTVVMVVQVVKQSQQISSAVEMDYAKGIARMGTAMAEDWLQGDDDWSDNAGTTLWSNKTVEGGSLSVSFSDARWDWCLVRSAATYGDESYVVTEDVNKNVAADLLVIHGLQAYLDPNIKKIHNLYLTYANSNPQFAVVTVDAVALDWSDESNGQMNNFEFDDDDDSWEGSAGKGAVVDFSPDVYVSSGNPVVISLVNFSFEVDRKPVTFYFRLKDNSTADFIIAARSDDDNLTPVVADNMAVNNQLAEWQNGTVLKNVALRNQGSAASSLTQMMLLWSNPASEKLSKVIARNRIIWSSEGPGIPLGAQGSGTGLDTQWVSLPLNTWVTFNEIQFDSDLSGKTIDLYAAFADGSVASFNIWSPVVPAQSDSLKVSTQNSYVSNKKVKGVEIENLSPTQNITWGKLGVSWTPSDSNTVQKIKYDNGTVWTGSANTGGVLDLDDTTLSAGGDKEDIEIEFSSSSGLSSYTLTLDFGMGDSSTKSVAFPSVGPGDN
jgi:hypothetical protein